MSFGRRFQKIAGVCNLTYTCSDYQREKEIGDAVPKPLPKGIIPFGIPFSAEFYPIYQVKKIIKRLVIL